MLRNPHLDANGNMVLRVQSSPADFNGDYSHDFFDVNAFMAAYNAGEPEADFNGDGQINFYDVTAFTEAYGPLDGTDLEHWHYSYDFRNQLVEVTHGVGNVTPVGTTNTYDALARRVLESTNGVTKQLVYGGVSHWEVLEQIDLSQSPETVLGTHVYGIGIDDEVSKFTRKHGPWNLVWSEHFTTRAEAMTREIYIKSMNSSRWIRDHLLEEQNE